MYQEINTSSAKEEWCIHKTVLLMRIPNLLSLSMPTTKRSGIENLLLINSFRNISSTLAERMRNISVDK